MKISFFTALFFIIFLSAIHGQGENDPLTEEYSARHIYSFTKNLVNQEEYYRAYTELLRLNAYHPGYLSPLEFSVMENYLLFRGRQFNTLLTKFDANTKMSNPPLLLFAIDASLELSRYERMDTLISQWTMGGNDLFDEMMFRRRTLSFCMTGNFTALEETRRMYAGRDFSAYAELVAWAKEGHGRLKSPVAASVFGIIPGMGYVYSGDTNTGLVALVVISLSAVLTYSAFHYNNKAAGIFIGAIGTFFYTGSILGGYMRTRNYNRSVMDQMKKDLINGAGLDKDHELLLNNFGPATHE
ncbi:MAG: hypothetical protein CVV44_13505 [Spirochaetae bacterium HGW-Spirochaetae-1]|nr:MAG: hypothetical protein CVV44_13505 [Spirochaetae bacterium HGW-Spirochaetae-1]